MRTHIYKYENTCLYTSKRTHIYKYENINIEVCEHIWIGASGIEVWEHMFIYRYEDTYIQVWEYIYTSMRTHVYIQVREHIYRNMRT